MIIAFLIYGKIGGVDGRTHWELWIIVLTPCFAEPSSSACVEDRGKGKREEEKSSLSLSTFLYKPRIRVVAALPNELLAAAASRPGYALRWVQRNVAAYYPAIQIAAMAVDNEMFASPHSSLIALLVPAMTNVHAALVRLRLNGAMKSPSPSPSPRSAPRTCPPQARS
uniref:Glucan endo-1,3-beta-D-glucosidase n=1 Tax=Ananas comosus var. bracteatus TaxID=296719 RepID=A0A6V7PY11_ANACO|nr:unnamed protein product [Ananas comosus var. bracteatus]